MMKYNPNYSIGNYIQDILSRTNNPVIFEIGVHWAEDTIRILNQSQGIPNYHGFEPDPRNFKEIQKKSFPVNVKFNQCAISDKEGIMDFHLSDGRHPNNGNIMTGANSLRTPKDIKEYYRWIQFDKKIKVPVKTLDSYCEALKISHIDFIWADMQGSEYDVIMGVQKILKSTRYAYLEYSDIELYQGQKNLDEYLEALRLTGDWELLHQFKTDALFQNKSKV